MAEGETVTFSKSTLYMSVIVVLLVGLFASLATRGFSDWGFNKAPTTAPTGTNPTGTNPTPTQQVPTANPGGSVIPTKSLIESTAGVLDTDPKIGQASAPLVMVEFSDFQCPFCKRYYDETYAQIKSMYLDTGKMQLVFRDFPLSFHQNAESAAVAAECAHEQGKWEEMHDMLFEKQIEWENVGAAKYKEYAQTLGLDTGKFNSCVDSAKYVQEVGVDFNAGVAAGIQGTPSFFIGKREGNAQKIVGACPFDTFQKAIAAEEQGKTWSVTNCQVLVS